MTCHGSQDTSFLSRSVNTRFKTHCCGSFLSAPLLGSGAREDVVTAYELTVLHEVVYIALVPAVIAAPAPLVVFRTPALAERVHRDRGASTS